ncbi:hypothetical protein [Rugamonas sp.]|uniref:hypothetical protein n=1 Tax=Rugamonas sp. TaxID=1926287 RepID=UPI0025E13DB3|nr:hypothetical protein [Rugamonas sp.]
MKSLALRALTVAGLSALSLPAMADAYSQVSFGGVTVTLIDLNPGDGIAPSITFLPNADLYEGSHVYGNVESWAPRDQYRSFDHTGKNAGSSVGDSTEIGVSRVAGSVTGAANGAGFSAMSLSGAAASTVAGHGTYNGYATVPFTADNTSFILSAHTLVSFSASAAIQTGFTVGYTAGGLEGEAAYGSLALYAGGSQPGDASDLEQQSLGFVYGTGDAPGAQGGTWNGTMTASYSNLGNASALGSFYAEADIGGRSVTSAVPEPSGCGMLLGGMALLAALARRRQAQ